MKSLILFFAILGYTVAYDDPHPINGRIPGYVYGSGKC